MRLLDSAQTWDTTPLRETRAACLRLALDFSEWTKLARPSLWWRQTQLER